MGPHELRELVDAAKANGRDEVVLKIRRKCSGEKVRVLPGVMGKVVQWGDGTWQFPTVAFVPVAPLDKALIRWEQEAAPERAGSEGEGRPVLRSRIGIGRGHTEAREG